ncbi:MAG: hypothetical protein RL728_773 [Bacteroidota bacterium]|jgi:hypothetical protein
MENELLTVNGLIDGISIIEKDSKQELPNYKSDILYNDKEPTDLDFQGLYYDEGFSVSNYDFNEFEGVNLISITTKEIKVDTKFSNDIIS